MLCLPISLHRTAGFRRIRHCFGVAVLAVFFAASSEASEVDELLATIPSYYFTDCNGVDSVKPTIILAKSGGIRLIQRDRNGWSMRNVGHWQKALAEISPEYRSTTDINLPEDAVVFLPANQMVRVTLQQAILVHPDIDILDNRANTGIFMVHQFALEMPAGQSEYYAALIFFDPTAAKPTDTIPVTRKCTALVKVQRVGPDAPLATILDNFRAIVKKVKQREPWIAEPSTADLGAEQRRTVAFDSRNTEVSLRLLPGLPLKEQKSAIETFCSHLDQVASLTIYGNDSAVVHGTTTTGNDSARLSYDDVLALVNLCTDAKGLSQSLDPPLLNLGQQFDNACPVLSPALRRTRIGYALTNADYDAKYALLGDPESAKKRIATADRASKKRSWTLMAGLALDELYSSLADTAYVVNFVRQYNASPAPYIAVQLKLLNTLKQMLQPSRFAIVHSIAAQLVHDQGEELAHLLQGGEITAEKANSLTKSLRATLSRSGSAIDALTPGIEQVAQLLTDVQRDEEYALAFQGMQERISKLRQGQSQQSRECTTLLAATLFLKQSINADEAKIGAIEPAKSRHPWYSTIDGYRTLPEYVTNMFPQYQTDINGRLWFYLNERNITRLNDSVYSIGTQAVRVGAEPDLLNRNPQFNPRLTRVFRNINLNWQSYCASNSNFRLTQQAASLYQALALCKEAGVLPSAGTDTPADHPIPAMYDNVTVYSSQTEEYAGFMKVSTTQSNGMSIKPLPAAEVPKLDFSLETMVFDKSVSAAQQPFVRRDLAGRGRVVDGKRYIALGKANEPVHYTTNRLPDGRIGVALKPPAPTTATESMMREFPPFTFFATAEEKAQLKHDNFPVSLSPKIDKFLNDKLEEITSGFGYIRESGAFDPNSMALDQQDPMYERMKLLKGLQDAGAAFRAAGSMDERQRQYDHFRGYYRKLQTATFILGEAVDSATDDHRGA